MINLHGCDDHRDQRFCDCTLIAQTVADNIPKPTTSRPLGQTGRQDLLDRIEALEIENAVLAKNYAIMLDTLGIAQEKGSALQDEARALRRVLCDRLSLPTLMGTVLVQHTEQFEILVDLLKVRWRGDCKYGTAEAHANLPLGFGHESADWADECLAAVRARKGPTGHASWLDTIGEEFLEMIVEGDETRVEAEALDTANVCLKMVESIRIRRERAAKEST